MWGSSEEPPGTMEAGPPQASGSKNTIELNSNQLSVEDIVLQNKQSIRRKEQELEVSDTNAELVKLGNQVAILEEEKGNLQLSLVDFDELKELYDVKQEISELEAENAESENLRVTAEMKVVDLEEQLEKLQSSLTSDAALNSEMQRLIQENERLQQKLSEATATKSSSEVGSTESFVKTGSNVDSTESFEALSADAERTDLLKKIDSLTRENEIEKLMNNSSVIEEDLFTARHQLQNLNNKLEQSKSIDEYNEILNTVNDRELTILELTDKLNRKQDNIDALTSQIESVTIENKELREKLSVEKSKFDDIHEHYQIQIEEINDLKRNKADVENMLLNLQLTHEEALQHAKNLSAELQEAYKSLELLKNKHTEDMNMLNRRLEDVIEDLQVKTQELESAQVELNEKNMQLEKCVPDDVKSHLEGQLTQLQKALAEGEERAQAQLENEEVRRSG
ncbi:unnamed protein product [Trichogramma brassicae]|uniref:Uncharacterized protein n=1 Tax=Trichogramma brassicae TaxID=86971 RepID=A0A6H5IE90_9HYME|nr:unnamed protein product [Trichogramma brassicae]